MMNRVLIPLLLVLAVSADVFSQCSNGGVAPIDSGDPVKADKPPVPDEIVMIEAPTSAMTTNIAFIVDTSGSMDNFGRVGMAITFANSIIGRPGDQLMISLFSFKNKHTRWPGLTEKERAAAIASGELDEPDGKGPPKGWTYFPGKPQLESAQKWLNGRGAMGGTNPVSALEDALAEKVDDLSIVLITDGEDFDIQAFKLAITIGQALREGNGLKRATIFVIGIGDNAHKRQHLLDVGKQEGGGMHVVRRPQPPPELELDLDGPDLDLDDMNDAFDDDWDD